MNKAEITENINDLILMVTKLALTISSHEVYMGQLDKNIMVHDELLNKICVNIGIEYDNNNRKYN